MQAVPAIILPLRDDASIKQFLLEPASRRAILASLGGCVRSVDGTKALPALLADRVMVCLMYSWTAENGLQACSSSGDQPPDRCKLAMISHLELESHPKVNETLEQRLTQRFKL